MRSSLRLSPRDTLDADGDTAFCGWAVQAFMDIYYLYRCGMTKNEQRRYKRRIRRREARKPKGDA